MRYVLHKPPTVRERIEDIRKNTKPLAGRQSRRGYMSKDDFAKFVGISRSRIYAWTRENRPDYPDETSRELLSAVSAGAYSADDFRKTEHEERELERRVASLEHTVERLERHIFGEDVAQDG